jgi:MFS family permease
MSLTATTARRGSPGILGFPAALRLLFLGDLATAVGIGLTQPYLVILLHSVKGVPLVTATALTSLLALASFPGNVLSGSLSDRIGGHRAMGLGLVAAACGLVTIAQAEQLVGLSLGMAAVGLGWSVIMPAYSTLIARVVAEDDRGRAFTFQHALLNAGMGAGAVAGAFLTFRAIGPDLALLWWIAAGTCVVGLGTLSMSYTRTPLSQRGTEPQKPEPGARGYRSVLADRAMRRVLLAMLLASAAGYGVFNAGLPVLAVLAGDPAVMAWVSVANCLTIVIGLPLGLRLAARLSPVRLLTATAALWSSAWLLCLLETETHLLGVRVTLPAAGALIGIGELLLAGSLPVMANALAPDALRGRYNGALVMAMTSGMWIGPLLAAGATGAHRVSALFVVAVVLLAAMALIGRGAAARTDAATDLGIPETS